MRSAPAALLALALIACGPAEPPAAEPAMTPAAPTLADFAGTWNTSTTLTGVADPVPGTLIGTADGVWMMKLTGRDSIPVTASMMGDSLVTQTADYESVLRPGVMVSVRTAAVIQDGMLMGNAIATYKTDGVTETVTGTVHGTRAPQ